MLSTHNPKLFNAKIKTTALVAEIINPVPEHVICSQNVNVRRKYWASPKSAADMKMWRGIAEKTSNNEKIELTLPDLDDGNVKQLLIPTDWRNNQYISVSPVASLGLFNEVHNRLYEQDLPFRRWTIQPTAIALPNHGETLMMQAGNIRMLRRGVIKQNESSDWTGNFVQLKATCQRMNISSGMLSVGFPALTSIGGLVHSLERQLNSEIEFAFGMESVEWVSGVPKVIANKSSGGLSTGRIKGKTINKVLPTFMTDEITANAEIVLLLRTNGDLNQLANLVKNINRISGGSLFNTEISIIENNEAPAVSYMIDASTQLNSVDKPDADILQKALDLYSLEGEWVNYKWKQPREHQYIINHSGYALLEEPNEKELSRNNYPHAWAEPTFSLINQGEMSNSAWWKREVTDAGCFWVGV